MPKLGNARRAYGSTMASGNQVHRHLKAQPGVLDPSKPAL